MSKSPTIAILAETVSKWERRSPLTPKHVSDFLRQQQGKSKVIVQPSTRRIFTDKQFEKAGAIISSDISSADVILGIKQPSVESLVPNKTYCFFSHTIKAQKQNMPLLDAMLDKNIRLFDYECITKTGQKDSPRLVAFGKHAGRAGMINTFRGLGERFLGLGYSTPFITISSAHSYPSYDDACYQIKRMGETLIRNEGSVPSDLLPLVFTFTGDGKVSKGAQEVFELLPHQMVSAKDLELAVEDVKKFMERNQSGKLDKNCIIGCVVKDKDVMRRIDDGASGKGEFSKQEYLNNPELYENMFQETISKLSTVVVTGHYWDSRYPRWMTSVGAFHQLRNEKENRLLMVADLSCDINGGIEFTTRSSSIDDPFYYVHFPTQEGIAFDEERVIAEEVSRDMIPLVEKEKALSLLIMGVDILPSELPGEASEHFGECLTPFLPHLIKSDAKAPFDYNAFPSSLSGSCIVTNGKLTPKFAYISAMRKEFERSQQAPILATQDPRSKEGVAILRCTGHMFDTGLINQMLNLVEEHHGEFRILDILVKPNSLARLSDDNASVGNAVPSTVVLQISMGSRTAADDMIKNLANLAKLTPKAEASVVEISKKGAMMLSKQHKEQEEKEKEQKLRSQMKLRGPAKSSLPAKGRVVVFGAGMVAGPAVEYLSRNPERAVIVASAIPQEARTLVERLYNPSNTNVRAHSNALDVTKDIGAVKSFLMKDEDGPTLAVVSLLPPPLHPIIAKCCIELGIPLVTSSYVSPEMKQLDELAKKSNVPILCEMGLDPGIDHMSAAKIIDDCHKRGETVTYFSSLCGGLPAPESANNPIGYKFSWTPKGVLSAMRNDATYKWDGNIVKVSGGSKLLQSAQTADVGYPSLALEHIPNRDSLIYGDLYNISKEANTIYRGTLRYKGFCSIMADLFDMDLLSRDPITNNQTWSQLLKSKHFKKKETEEFLRWLEIYKSDQNIESIGDKKASNLEDAMCYILEKKLQYAKNERDMAIMQHTFKFKNISNGKETGLASTLLAIGNNNEPGGTTAMAKTVGITAAIGAEIIISNRKGFKGGIMIPTLEEIYAPGLKMLEKEGIVFVEKHF